MAVVNTSLCRPQTGSNKQETIQSNKQKKTKNSGRQLIPRSSRHHQFPPPHSRRDVGSERRKKEREDRTTETNVLIFGTVPVSLARKGPALFLCFLPLFSSPKKRCGPAASAVISTRRARRHSRAVGTTSDLPISEAVQMFRTRHSGTFAVGLLYFYL